MVVRFGRDQSIQWTKLFVSEKMVINCQVMQKKS